MIRITAGTNHSLESLYEYWLQNVEKIDEAGNQITDAPVSWFYDWMDVNGLNAV